MPPERLLTEDGARAYRRFLEWSVGAGFKLAVIEVTDSARRDALVAWTVATVPETRTLRLDRATREPLRDLLDQIASPPGEMAALVLTHLEEASDRRLVCAQLNVQRDELVRAFAVPWVVVVHPNAALDLQRDAPDFSDIAGLWLPESEKTVTGVTWRSIPEALIAQARHPELSGNAPGSRLLARADAAIRAGRYDEARDLLAQHGVVHPEAAGTTDRTLIEGRLLHVTGRFSDARARFQDALESSERSGDKRGTAAALHSLGGVLLAQGDLAGARGALERSLEILAKVLGTDKHRDVAASLHELSRVLEAQGDLASARRTQERSLDITIKLLGTEEHPDVALSLQGLGVLLGLQGDLVGARGALERSLDIWAKVLGTEDHPFVAVTLHALGRVFEAQGDLAGARRVLERSLGILAKVLGTVEHPHVAATLHSLGSVLQAQGDLVGARRALERSLDIKTKILGTEHPDVAVSLQTLGGVLRVQGDLAGARRALERSLDINARVMGTEDHREVAATLHALGGVLSAQGDLAGAHEALVRSLDILVKVVATEEHPDVATTHASIGAVLADKGRTEEAVASYRRALAIRDKCFGTRDHYMSAETEVSLATALFQLNQADEAHALLQHALQVLEQQVPNHPMLQQFRVQGDISGPTPTDQPDALCPCGSEKSFRKCHGMPDDPQAVTATESSGLAGRQDIVNRSRPGRS